MTSITDDQHTRILAFLDRLLYDAQVRDAFIEGGADDPRVELDDDLRDAFSRVDLHELRLVGKRVRSEVLGGGIGTGAGIKAMFEQTLDLFHDVLGMSVHDIADEFIASPHFRSFRDVPFSPAGRGVMVPEAFYAFLVARPDLCTDPDVEPCAHHEAATAITAAVATGASATFDVALPGASWHSGVLCIHRHYPAGGGSTAQSSMYLAGNGRCVRGPATRETFEQVVNCLDAIAADENPEPASDHRMFVRIRQWGLVS